MGKARLQNFAKRAAAKEDGLLETRAALVADPEDARLTLDGAVVDDKGKIDVGAYEDLHSWYAGEPSPNLHPYPNHPGLHHGEEVAKGLKIWDDLRAGYTEKEGAGWIASRSARKGEPSRTKWFNIRTTGSWRLAFLLARLQRDLWERRGGPGFNQRASLAAGSSTGAPSASGDAGAPGDDEDELEVLPADNISTPKKTRPKAATPEAASPAAPASSRKRPRAGRSPGAAAPKKEQRQQQQHEPPQKTTLAADALSGSVRVQQILAARRAQEEAAAAAAAAAQG